MPRLTALLVLAALALAALGAYDVMRGDPDLATAAEPPPAPAAPPAPALDLATAHTPVGTVVTSGGKTLYRFDKDTAKPSKSACTGQCATNWPPLLEDGKPKLTGVEPGLVGIAVRPDGSRQVTLGGWPLYRYSGDKAPAEVRGEGMAGGAWHAVGVNGKPAAATKPKPRGGS
ncbi:COG4315 family predicted lipoprotein [Pseudonocardia acaciae]|uniref:COG4315 family predicted lipoprotein n=1 Tax=Pseudonocardia acaciae TaxID=551276 RepID=UPI0009FC7869|nr:hypothetical protein [Pseudonocardia acaciae]